MNNQKENDLIAKLMDSTYYTPVFDVISRAIGTQESVYIAKLIRLYNAYRKSDKIDNENFFYITIEELEFQTGLSYSQQIGCEKTMTEWGFLETQLKTVPARKHYKINIAQIKNLISLEDEINKIFEDKENKSKKESIYKLFKEKFISEEEQKNIQKRIERIGHKSKENKLQNKFLENSKTSLNEILKHNNRVNNKVININNKDKSLLATSLPDNDSSLIKEIKPLSDEEQLFDYWNMIANENKNEKPPLNKFQPIPNHLKFRNGKPTNIYTRALHLIEVRLKRFSKEEIAQTFNLYAEIFYNPDIYKLKSKFKTDRMNIDDFFEIKKLDRASMKSYALSKNIESWFDEMIKGRDYLLKTYSCQPSPNQKQIQSAEDKYPDITQQFKWAWRNAMEIDKRFVLTTPEKDENAFRKASIFLKDFIKKWYDQLPETLPAHDYNEVYLSKPHTLAHNFIPAILFATEGMDDSIKITTSWLHTPKMEERLVRYYRDQGCMSDPLDDQDEKYDMEAYNL